MKPKVVVPKPAPRTYYVRGGVWCVNFMRINTDALIVNLLPSVEA
jgi:hypothetical protein